MSEFDPKRTSGTSRSNVCSAPFSDAQGCVEATCKRRPRKLPTVLCFVQAPNVTQTLREFQQGRRLGASPHRCRASTSTRGIVMRPQEASCSSISKRQFGSLRDERELQPGNEPFGAPLAIDCTLKVRFRAHRNHALAESSAVGVAITRLSYFRPGELD
jgi:hypothetical protein